MDFETASRIVIGHVTDGVEIAKKSHLPEQIINFITTHHGRGKTKYFYNSFINANPDKMPNEEAYTYPRTIAQQQRNGNIDDGRCRGSPLAEPQHLHQRVLMWLWSK